MNNEELGTIEICASLQFVGTVHHDNSTQAYQAVSNDCSNSMGSSWSY